MEYIYSAREAVIRVSAAKGSTTRAEVMVNLILYNQEVFHLQVPFKLLI